MTTPDIDELIDRLYDWHNTSAEQNRLDMQKAADLLQSQAERIKELEEEIGGWREDQKENIGVAFALQREVNKITSERDELREKYTDTYWALNDAARENTSLRAQLTEIAATEPSMIYHGRCIIDCGDSGHQDVTMLKMIARETKLFTRPMPAQDVKDAERYRWLREQHWSTDTIAVVLNPKQAVKLGHVCPSDSLLDETIDAAIAKGAK